jgi:Spy/CpxP family protein refolding chaperone
MKRKIRPGILVAHLLLILAFATAAWAAQPRSLVPHWWECSKLIGKLDLSDEQKTRIADIRTEQEKKITRAEKNFLKEHREMRRFLTRKHLDDDKAEKLIDSLAEALSDLLKAELEMHYAMLRELHPEQRRAVLAAVEKEIKYRPAKTKKQKSGSKDRKRTSGKTGSETP